MYKYKKLALLLITLLSFAAQVSAKENKQVIPAAECLHEYLPGLKGKRIALLVNQTSVIGKTHLLDTLLQLNVDVKKIFVPEHGFRGTADAGAHIKNDLDTKTGIPIISLYGNNKKPKSDQLKDIDLVLFDLQDVGTRFYTYISTLEYLMEACAENNKKLIVLDRPNPHGHYVDGPVLEESQRSFVGMQPVPIVYGMTIGEYAKMLKGEKWFKNAEKLELQIIGCKNYDHTVLYKLTVPPSPNLKEMNAIYLYPSLCFFEGTVISVGRGTDRPFQQWGHPDLGTTYTQFFIPKSVEGATKPMYEGKKCYGQTSLKTIQSDLADTTSAPVDRIHLTYLLDAYKYYPDKDKFFNSFFEKLAGTTRLREQVKSGIQETAIRQSWQKDIEAFKKIRKKYLLYKDFE